MTKRFAPGAPTIWHCCGRLISLLFAVVIVSWARPRPKPVDAIRLASCWDGKRPQKTWPPTLWSHGTTPDDAQLMPRELLRLPGNRTAGIVRKYRGSRMGRPPLPNAPSGALSAPYIRPLAAPPSSSHQGIHKAAFLDAERSRVFSTLLILVRLQKKLFQRRLLC